MCCWRLFVLFIAEDVLLEVVCTVLRCVVAGRQIQGVLAGRDSRHHVVIEGLHARYPDQLSALGFDVTRVKGSKEVTWQAPSSDCIHHLQVALAGLHHDGSGLETYI